MAVNLYALKNVIEYCKKNRNVKLYIDQHGDYYNMHVNTWKEKIVHHHILRALDEKGNSLYGEVLGSYTLAVSIPS